MQKNYITVATILTFDLDKRGQQHICMQIYAGKILSENVGANKKCPHLRLIIEERFHIGHNTDHQWSPSEIGGQLFVLSIV